MGKTLVLDYLSADGHADRYPALVAECVRLNPDVIARNYDPRRSCSETRNRDDSDRHGCGLATPIGTGIVDSLARPGGNITGMSQMTPSLAAKRLELLKEAVPG